MNQKETEEIEIDLKEIFFLLVSRIWIIVAATLVCGIGSLIFTKAFITPLYSSTSTIVVLSKSTSLTSLADIQLSSQLTSDYEILINSRRVLEEVIHTMKLDMTYEELRDIVSVTNESDSRVLSITVTHEDKVLAMEIVNEIADVSCEKIAELMATTPPSLVDKGVVADKKTSPSTTRNTIVGAFAGFALSVIIIIVIYLMNDSIRTAEDVEKYLGINTLGTIPLMEGTSKRASHGRDKDAVRLRRQKERERRRQKKLEKKAAQADNDQE